jgi:hypothetical protein
MLDLISRRCRQRNAGSRTGERRLLVLIRKADQEITRSPAS